METFTLVPDIENPIVECHNLNLPIPTDVQFNHNPGYDTTDGHKRYVGNPIGSDDDILYFDNMMRNNVIPLLYSHERFNWSWPVKMQTILNNITIRISIAKDEIGFYQNKHEDPRIFLVSGVLHLQDCEQGTHFIESGYTAPTKKFSGAFWSNSQRSYHMVPEVTSERLVYLILAQWNFLPGYFPKS